MKFYSYGKYYQHCILLKYNPTHKNRRIVIKQFLDKTRPDKIRLDKKKYCNLRSEIIYLLQENVIKHKI